jgi:hypothetical protein
MTDPLREDAGLVKIHSVCVNMGAVWRPTPSHDVGVDGQIEFLEPGASTSTGLILAVQSKCGPSYFTHQDDHHVYFHPDPKHRRYWRALRLPIILALHDPETDVTLYANIKPQLTDAGPISVSKASHLDPSARSDLVKIAEDETLALSDPARVLSRLRSMTLERPGPKSLSGIDFLLAGTEREGDYFELRMCRIRALFSLVEEGPGFSIGHADYEFILRNVLELHGNRIVEDFLDEFNAAWFELLEVPDITVALTHRGTALLDYLWKNLNSYLSVEAYSHLGLANVNELAREISTAARLESDRLDSSGRIGIEPR